MESSGEQFDVIVVGAGIMGSCTTYEIAKRGHKVLLLEQFDFLHHRGSSHGESRTIRETYPEEYYSGMVKEASNLWEEAESEIGYKVYFRTSHFDMGPSDNKSLLSVIANCESNSIPYRKLNRAEVAGNFFGRIDIPENWIGVSTELGGVIKPTKAVCMFQTLAIQNGAVLRDNTEVEEIIKDQVNGGVLVNTSNDKSFRGKKCVVAVGAWMKKLVKSLIGVELPVQPLETTIFYWRIKEADFSIGGCFPTFASYGEPYVYGTPSLEFPGLIKVAAHCGSPCDPDRRLWAQGTGLSSLKEWVRERFSGLVDYGGPVTTQSCMYSMTPDGDFIIDFLGGEFGKDVVIGGGFSGHGFKMAPVVGRILGDLVLNEESESKGVDLKRFALGRFERNAKGNVKGFEDQVGFTPHLSD